MLLNPSTGPYFSIPPPIDHPSKDHRLGIFSVNVIGFGYDCLNDDYKVVEIVEYDLFGLRIRDTLVYSLKKNSWRVNESVSLPIISLKINETGALVNNHLLHWLFKPRFPRIACFDLRSEQWAQNVPLPDLRWHKKGDDLVHLSVFDGCLCLLTKEVSFINSVNVWVMKEYGVKESWVKLLGVSDLPCTMALHTYPISYHNDEILVTCGGEDGIFFTLMWYNIKVKRCRRAEIHTIHEVNNTSITNAYICHGSLVTIPGGKQIRKEPPP
ncbi:F-box protein CPR1 [Bienertia sinuspersici]